MGQVTRRLLIKEDITSTFFNSNSSLCAKHELPNVSQGPLLPDNLHQNLFYHKNGTSENCKKEKKKSASYSVERQAQKLTDLRPSIMRNVHRLQVQGNHSCTSKNICWHLIPKKDKKISLRLHPLMDYVNDNLLLQSFF